MAQIKRLTIATMLVTLAISTAQGSLNPKENDSWFPGVIFAAYNYVTSYVLTTTPSDYLNVCKVPVSKSIQTSVKETLEINTDNMVKLGKAIDEDSVPKLLEVVGDAKQILNRKIAAIEGTIFAAIDSARSPSLTSHDKRCTEEEMTELQSSFQALLDVQSETNDAASEATKIPGGQEFYQIYQELNDLMVQVRQFISDPTEGQRIRGPCELANLPQLIPRIVEELRSLKPILDDQDRQGKFNAIESAAGLLAEAITLNAICHGELNVDQSDDYQENIMKSDIKVSENAANDLDGLVRAIIGTSRRSYFRQLFSY